MEKQKKEFKVDSIELANFRLHQKEYETLLKYFLDNPEKNFSTFELVQKIPAIHKWNESDLIKNLYRLEELKLIQIVVIQEHPVIKYQIEINSSDHKTFLKLIDCTFRIDFEFDYQQFEKFISGIETECYDGEYQKLLDYWENEHLRFVTQEERKDKIIQLRDKYKEQYFSPRNVLAMYCVHSTPTLINFLTKEGKYIPLNVHPFDFFSSSKTSIEKLRYVIYFRFKQFFQFLTLNNLLEIELTAKDKFEEFKRFVEKEWMEIFIANFKTENPDYTKLDLEARIKTIESFIDNAHKVDYEKAKEKENGKLRNNSDEFVYQRLSKGYYSQHKIDFVLNSPESMVYAKYFLLYEWLKESLKSYTPESPKDIIPHFKPLKHRQIAILYHAFNIPITEGNKDLISSKHGQTSGKKLKGYFSDLSKNPETHLKYDISYITELVELLKDKGFEVQEKILTTRLSKAKLR